MGEQRDGLHWPAGPRITDVAGFERWARRYRRAGREVERGPHRWFRWWKRGPHT